MKYAVYNSSDGSRHQLVVNIATVVIKPHKNSIIGTSNTPGKQNWANFYHLSKIYCCSTFMVVGSLI